MDTRRTATRTEAPPTRWRTDRASSSHPSPSARDTRVSVMTCPPSRVDGFPLLLCVIWVGGDDDGPLATQIHAATDQPYQWMNQSIESSLALILRKSTENSNMAARLFYYFPASPAAIGGSMQFSLCASVFVATPLPWQYLPNCQPFLTESPVPRNANVVARWLAECRLGLQCIGKIDSRGKGEFSAATRFSIDSCPRPGSHESHHVVCVVQRGRGAVSKQ